MKTNTLRSLAAITTLLITMIFGISANAQNENPLLPRQGNVDVDAKLAGNPYDPDSIEAILWRAQQFASNTSRVKALQAGIDVLSGKVPVEARTRARGLRIMAAEALKASQIPVVKGGTGEGQEFAKQDAEAFLKAAEALEAWKPVRTSYPVSATEAAGQRPAPTVQVTTTVTKPTPAPAPEKPRRFGK